MQIMTTTGRTLYVHIVLNSETFLQIWYEIVPYAKTFYLPSSFSQALL